MSRSISQLPAGMSPIFTPASPGRRVISLLPAATELVAALGAADRLVGITHECDAPAAVLDRPRVTTTAVDATADAAVVDVQVRALVASGAPTFALLADRIAALAPDLMLTQALCDVCAISADDVRAIAAHLVPPPGILELAGTTVDGILADIAHLAAALGDTAGGERLIASLAARLAAVHDRLAAARAPRPAVAVIEWTDPLFAAGHWVPDMVRRAGGRDVLAEPGSHSVTVAADAIRAAAPDVVLIAPCGYDGARAADVARALVLAAPDWLEGRTVWALDANGLVSRPGPRVVDGIETMGAILHPDLFPPPPAAHATRIA